MHRPIQVSTDVFAAIWARREAGESTEDAILRRLLGCAELKEEPPAEPAALADNDERIGFRDDRNGVDFPEGFKIFRSYKGREYVAVARQGFWIRTDNLSGYKSLNQLNESIAKGPENVWNGNWKFRAADGSIKSINALRTRSRIFV